MIVLDACGASIDVVVPGEPVPKARPRLGRGGRTYTPRRTATWEQRACLLIQSQASRTSHQPPARIRSGPVWVEVVAVWARPVRLQTASAPVGRIWRDKRPDLDNIVKAALDAAQLGGAYADDGQVARITASAYYAAVGEEAHLRLRIGRLEDL